MVMFIDPAARQNLVQKKEEKNFVIHHYEFCEKWRKRAFYFFIAVLVVGVSELLVLLYAPSAFYAPFQPNQALRWGFIIGYSIMPPAYLIIFWWLGRALTKVSRDVAFHTALSVAQELEDDHAIQAAAYANKLLAVFPYLLKRINRRSVNIAPWRCSPKLKELLYVHPRGIQRKRVLGAIQACRGEASEFEWRFYAFAAALSKEKEEDDYLAATELLNWLTEKSETHKLRPLTLLDRLSVHSALIQTSAFVVLVVVSVLNLVFLAV